MPDPIRVLARGNGQTVYCASDGRIQIRFDSIEDRQRYDAECELLARVYQEDIAGAAQFVFEIINEAPVDPDDLLEVIPDETAREVIRLELERLIEQALGPRVAAMEAAWRPDDD